MPNFIQTLWAAGSLIIRPINSPGSHFGLGNGSSYAYEETNIQFLSEARISFKLCNLWLVSMCKLFSSERLYSAIVLHHMFKLPQTQRKIQKQICELFFFTPRAKVHYSL